jgi:nucleotide-binding universal stress UspA family protein
VELIYRKEGIKTDTILMEGDPASVILDEAERGDYDLVIMKTHTMKKRKRFMLGSVTNKVVHHINKPILIMR